ncbi:MAG: hypothetical protein KAS93_05365 [Gammaproteobacteria bacterium]|nr:hypothetical protein [Gammaproteobacteria bacterium]
MRQDSLAIQLKRGNNRKNFGYLFALPLVFFFLTGMFIFLSHKSMALFKYEIVAFIIYYLACIYLMRSIAGLYLLQTYLCFVAAIFTTVSCFMITVQYIPIKHTYDHAINIPYPYNWIFAIIMLLSYSVYLIRKARQLNIAYLAEEFKRTKICNPKKATYVIYPPPSIKSFIKRKIRLHKDSPFYKKIHFLLDEALGYFLVFIYGFFPTAPFTLRGIGHGRPLTFVMLLGALFFVVMFGLGAELYFSYFLAFRRIEKEIGQSLRPIVKSS